MYVLLEYFVASVYFIRVVQQGSVYESMGLSEQIHLSEHFFGSADIKVIE